MDERTDGRMFTAVPLRTRTFSDKQNDRRGKLNRFGKTLAFYPSKIHFPLNISATTFFTAVKVTTPTFSDILSKR